MSVRIDKNRYFTAGPAQTNGYYITVSPFCYWLFNLHIDVTRCKYAVSGYFYIAWRGPFSARFF